MKTPVGEEYAMLPAVVVGVTAASRGKVRSLVSLSRRLSTDQPGSPLPETAAPLPDSEPPAVKQWRPRKDPGGCSVLLFPGQGSQFVGMGRGLLKYPNVKEMFTVAQKILGYDLLSLCLEGPEEELMKTVHCQPAVFVTSLAAVERLNHANPKVAVRLSRIICKLFDKYFEENKKKRLFQPLKCECFLFWQILDK